MPDDDHDVVIFSPRYWEDIGNALHTAMYNRGIDVKLLASYWPHTPKYQVLFISSLAAINETSKGSMETVVRWCTRNSSWWGGMYSSFYSYSL